MNDRPRDELLNIVARYGDELCTDARLCEALLRDLCPGLRREVTCLVNAVKAGVPADLQTSSDGVPPEMLQVRLSKRLQDDFAMTPEASNWAVEAWARALRTVAPVSSAVPPSSSGETINEKDGSVLIRIPGGTFTMGHEEYDAYNEERPAHMVTLSPYLIGKYTVTVGQFRRFVDATGYQTEAERGGVSYVWTGSKWEKLAGANWRRPRGDGQALAADVPVVQVSWNDAEAYCKWAGLRLPTEAEWEFAARGTDARKYPWGNKWDGAHCCTSFGGAMGSAGGPMPVGSYRRGASPFGCLDMAGNVWQWTASWIVFCGKKYSVLRGGSWVDTYPPHHLCGDYGRDEDYGSGDIGFRVARTPSALE